MTVTQIGFKPATTPGASLAPITRQYTTRVGAGMYGNTINPFHQVKEGDRITRLAILYRAGTAGTVSNMTVNAYLTNSTGTTEGARVATGVVGTDVATPGYYWVDVDVDLSAYVGQYIKPSGGSSGSGRPYYTTCTAGDAVSADHAANTTFGTATGRTNMVPMYMEITNNTGPAVTSVNDGNPLIPGVPATFTAVNFTDGAPNSILLDGIACEVTPEGFIPPPLADGQAIPLPGARTLVVSNNTQTAPSVNVTVAAPTGMIIQPLSGTLNVSDVSALHALNPAAEAGDSLIHPVGYEVSDTGLPKTDQYGRTVFYLRKANTKIARAYYFVTGKKGK